MRWFDRYSILTAVGVALVVVYLLRGDAPALYVGAVLLLAGVFGPRLKILEAGRSGLRMELKERVVRRVTEKAHVDVGTSSTGSAETKKVADALAAETPEAFADSLVDLVRLGSMAVTGRVTDAATHEPLDNVCVYVGIPGALCWTITNTAGEYIVDIEKVGASPGSDWELYFVRPGYETTKSQRVRLPGPVQILNIRMERERGGTGPPPPAPAPANILQPPPPESR